MKVLILGRDNFVSSNLEKVCDSSCEIYYSEADLTSPANVISAIGGHNYEVVVYVPNKPSKDVQENKADELTSFGYVQFAALSSGVKKLLVIERAGDIDLEDDIVNVTEDGYANAVPRFGKATMGKLICQTCSHDRISTYVRLFDVFGADITDSYVAKAIKKAKSKKATIEASDRRFATVFYLDALAVINELIVGDYPRGSYNLAGYNVSEREVASAIKSYYRKNDREVTVETLAVALPEYTADTTKLSELMPGVKFRSLAKAVAETIEPDKEQLTKAKAKKSRKKK